MTKEQKRVKLYEIYNDFLKSNDKIEQSKLWYKFIETLITEPYAININKKIFEINSDTVEQYINNPNDKDNFFYLDELFKSLFLCFNENVNC